MLFSDYFQIQTDGSESWFDPILDDDTLLFVDPFLIYLEDEGVFHGAYDKIMDFFSTVFLDAATIPRNVGSPRLNLLTNKVKFKEPKEACLGYSVGSVNGAGSGSGFAKSIISAVYDSINAGINNLKHFEELGIFGSDIGEDRISDMTINILKQEFISYTQEICRNLGIPMQRLPSRSFNSRIGRWENPGYDLPKNPFTDGPIILIPKKFLSSINALNSDNFADYCWNQFEDSIKDQFNVDLKSKLNKNMIVDIARQNQDWVSSYFNFKQGHSNIAPYDLEIDPDGVYRWHKETELFVRNNPISLNVDDQDSYVEFLDAIASRFVSYIEEHDGYLMLLTETAKPKNVRAAQMLLYGMIKHYCSELGCKFDIKEPGKGIVNFKFSPTMERDAMMEIKYVRISGIKKTLESYLEKAGNGDQVIMGCYFVVGFKQTEMQKCLDLEEEILELASEYNFDLKYRVIDASAPLE